MGISFNTISIFDISSIPLYNSPIPPFLKKEKFLKHHPSGLFIADIVIKYSLIHHLYTVENIAFQGRDTSSTA
jgi:hypothetical protein